MTKQNIQYIAKVGILGAIAAILMLLECPLPFAPPFYELNFSEIAVLIAGFALGPVAGIITEIIKITLNLIITGTDTAFVGELSNLIMGIALVLPAALIYKYHKSFKGAVVGMIAGTVSLIIIGAFVNYYIMIPAYIAFLELDMDTIVGMGNEVNSAITDPITLILYATVPFNAVKGVSCSFLTALIYKRVSPILHKNFGKK